uniref:Uncharacterized protein n=1 Tax=Neobodo designis TaxID=312471 RepID=A0A7S1Q6R5_NEODS|mmetsp:Transcript_32405/g.100228  ORF Transcript_32405/g.100228 Transcript_32405/m.100228 type:complete len:408 (+) Transcript_32405:38-1261(+)
MLSAQSRCRRLASSHHVWPQHGCAKVTGSSIGCGGVAVATHVRALLTGSPVLLRAGSDRHKPRSPSEMRQGTPLEGFNFTGIEPKPGHKAIRTDGPAKAPAAKRSIEDTVVARSALRRGFGSKVSDEQLLTKNYEKMVKDGLHVNIEVDDSLGPNDVPTGKPRERSKAGRFWQAPREQPLNPHYNMAIYKPSMSPKKRMRDGTTLNVSRDQLNHPHKMTSDQVFRVADSFAAMQWYAPVWKVFRRFDLQKLKRYRHPAQILATFLFACMGCTIYYLYMCEMDCFLQLDPQDQLDLNRLFMWIRISDFKAIADEVMEQHDPLHVLKPKEQLELVIAECRSRGLTELDPELAGRRYESLVRQPDMYHIFYWMTMYIGWCFGGGQIYWSGFERLKDEKAGAMHQYHLPKK